jgi:hypothetical protein
MQTKEKIRGLGEEVEQVRVDCTLIGQVVSRRSYSVYSGIRSINGLDDMWVRGVSSWSSGQQEHLLFAGSEIGIVDEWELKNVAGVRFMVIYDRCRDQGGT